MYKTGRFLQNRADDVGITMLAVMFLTFVGQILWRYILNDPLTWSVELCLILWLWTVFWGSAFCVRDKEHVRFDMLYLAVRPRTQRIFAAISALAIIICIIASWPGTYDYVTFLKIKKSGTLRIPLAYVFSIYLVFMVALVVTYVGRLIKIFKGNLETDVDERGGLEE